MITSVTFHHTYASLLVMVVLATSADMALAMLKALLQKPLQHITPGATSDTRYVDKHWKQRGADAANVTDADIVFSAATRMDSGLRLGPLRQRLCRVLRGICQTQNTC